MHRGRAWARAWQRAAKALGAPPLLLGAALVSAPAAAQDDDGLYWAERLGNRITITATRTPTEAQDVPATVTVITAEQIADELATDVKDLVRYEPGVSVAPRAGAVRCRARHHRPRRQRGLHDPRHRRQPHADPRRRVRVPDGFSFGAQSVGRGDYVDLGLVKSVEILRGPASALYGSDGLAGAVAFTLSEPSDFLTGGQDVAGLVRAAYSSDDDEFAETAIVAGRNGALSMLVGYTRRDFHELDNQGTDDAVGAARTTPNPQKGNSDAVLGRLVFEPGGGHKLRLTGEYTDTYLYTDVLSGLGPNGLGAVVDLLFGEDTGHRARVAADWTWQGAGAIEYVQVGAYWQDAERPAVHQGGSHSFGRSDAHQHLRKPCLWRFGRSPRRRSTPAVSATDWCSAATSASPGSRDCATAPSRRSARHSRPAPSRSPTSRSAACSSGTRSPIADGLVTLFPALAFRRLQARRHRTIRCCRLSRVPTSRATVSRPSSVPS